jgi:uncharacterized protein YbaR (Trm112 family)
MSPQSAVDPELLQILACPDCHGSVREVDDAIRCDRCGRVYPVRTVPVMLVEESTPGA